MNSLGKLYRSGITLFLNPDFLTQTAQFVGVINMSSASPAPASIDSLRQIFDERLSVALESVSADGGVADVAVDDYARRKPAEGQLGLFAEKNEKQKPLFSKKPDDEPGRWVTVRGVHIFISDEDGRVMKGPKEMIGKTKQQIEAEKGSAGEGGAEKPKPTPINELGRIQGGKGKDGNKQGELFGGKEKGLFDGRGVEKPKPVEPAPEPAPEPSPPPAEVKGADPDDHEAFTLQPPPKPAKKGPDFGNNDNSKQGGLFDAGKKGELEGQQLLFNSDPGDLNNPKTMENRVPSPPAEPDGPKDGEINEAGLVFRNGRWHRDGKEIDPKDIAAKARQNGENIWAAAKRELGVQSMGEIPPELRKELGDAMAAAPAAPAAGKPEPSPPSAGRQRAMEKQKEQEQSDPIEEKPDPSSPVVDSKADEMPTPVSDAEEKGDTPRESAQHYYDTQKHDEYAWARESEVSNAGKDLLGSARHKRNEWRTLEELEERGSAVAEEMITRANLMKRNPPNLAVLAEKNPITALAMHLALNSIPARPYGIKPGEVHRDSEKKKLARKQYAEAFESLRNKAEELAEREDDPMKALSEFAKHADKIREGYSAKDGTYVAEQFNNMITIHNRTQTALIRGGFLDINQQPGRGAKAVNASTQIRNFAQLARENYGPDWMEHDDVQEKAIDVITGSGIDKVFGIKKEPKKGDSGKYQFKPEEAYENRGDRKGGPAVDTSTVKKSQGVMMDALAMGGLQYGNSMTDDERKYHTARAAESFVDLADVLGIPDKAVGMNGKLGVAFGARGRAGNKAHYEPSSDVINLTRNNGAGSLAHEWAHFFDYNSGEDGDKENRATKSYSGNMKKLKEAWESAKSRIQDAVLADHRAMGFDARWAKVKYWTSDVELFARYTERMIQKKLRDQGRENAYLVGLHKSTHRYWPTDAELEKAMPYLEAMFKEYGERFEKEHGKAEKKDRYQRIQELMAIEGGVVVDRSELIELFDRVADRYYRTDSESVVQVDHYIHPMTAAALHQVTTHAVNSLARPGILRNLIHAAVGTAFAAWIAHSAAVQAANSPSPSASPSPSVAASAPASPMNQAAPAGQAQPASQTAQPTQPAAGGGGQPAQAPSSPPAGNQAAQPAPAAAPAVPAAAVPAAAPQKPGKLSTSISRPSAGGGSRPLRDPEAKTSGSFDSQHPRHPAGAPGSKGGEFAPKGGAESGGGSGGESGGKSDESIPKFYFENGDKSAEGGSEPAQSPVPQPSRPLRDPEESKKRPLRDPEEQKPWEKSGNITLGQPGQVNQVDVDESQPLHQPAARSMDDLIQEHLAKHVWAHKTAPELNPRKIGAPGMQPELRGGLNQPHQPAPPLSSPAEAPKPAPAPDTSFDPAKLEAESSKMIDDVGESAPAPKEEDFDSAKDYEAAVAKHNRSAGSKRAAIKKRAAKNLIPDIASEHDLDHEHLRQAVEDEISSLMPFHKRQEEARKYISEMNWNSRRINQAEDRGLDSDSSNWDAVASEWAGQFPEFAGTDESQWVSRMWDLGKQGAQDPPSANDEDLVRRVAKRLVDQGSYTSAGEEELGEPEAKRPVYSEADPDSPVPFHRSVVFDLVDRYVRNWMNG